MKPLGREARSVIEAARKHEGIRDGDRDRLRARVMARAAAAGSVIAATTAVSDVAAKSTATTALGSGVQLASGATKLGVSKLWLAVAVTATGAGGAASVYALRDAPQEQVASLTVAVDRGVRDLAPRVADRTRTEAQAATRPVAPPPADAAAPGDAPPSSALATTPTDGARSGDAGGQGTASADGLAAENELLSRAQIAFGQGNLEAAIDLLYQHESRFPRGALAIERRALLAIALCKKGRFDEGARTAGRLMDRSTPLGTRIADACERK